LNKVRFPTPHLPPPPSDIVAFLLSPHPPVHCSMSYMQTNFLTEQTKHDTLWDLPRDSSSEKVTGLFNAYNDLFDEMQHQYMLRKYSLLSWMVSSLPTMSTVAFFIAVIINGLLLVSVSVAPRVAGTHVACFCMH
jgi:hypothetical protein